MADHTTNITWLWLPTVLFAHAFAAFWLLKTMLLNDPQALSFLWRRRRQASRSVLQAREAAAAAAAASADVVLHLPKGVSKGGALPATGLHTCSGLMEGRGMAIACAARKA